MASISFLGTGSGFPSADRFFSSAMVLAGGRHLLVDAGEPCVHLLRDRGNLLKELDDVLITHGHVDHVGGLPALLHGCMLLGRSKPLGIHLPPDMIAPLRSWISALYLTEEGFGFPVVWSAWSDRTPVALGDVVVTPYANSHLADSYRALPGADSSRPCLSFSLEIRTGSFRSVFSGDLSSPGELLPLLDRPLDVLVSELSHFEAEELATVLKGVKLHALCLVHLSEDLASDSSELQALMEELLPEVGDVLIPEDGEVLDF